LYEAFTADPFAPRLAMGNTLSSTRNTPDTTKRGQEGGKEEINKSTVISTEEEIDDWRLAIERGGCAKENEKVQACHEYTKDWRRCRFEVTSLVLSAWI
jgi:hypothetical protein